MDLLRALPLKGRVEENVPMKEMTTLRVGGPADCAVFARDEEDAARVVRFCAQECIPLTVIGRGSNLLVRDGGLSGVVLVMSRDFAQMRVQGERLHARAGASLHAAAGAARDAGLSGLEFAEGIPGTVGGGIRMNAGAYGGEMSQVTESVRVLCRDGEIRQREAKEMEFSYRRSALEESGEIVLGAVFHLRPDSPKEISARMKDFAERRREKQPLNYPSAGSFFKRPEGYFAGKLIEDAGLKGFRVGGAQVSEKHAGFLINTGEATAADFLCLKEYIQKVVHEKYGVTLEPEVRILGRD